MKRNRIIIYLDTLRGGAKQPPHAGVNEAPQVQVATRRSGVARPLIIIGVILLVLIGGVIGGAYFWWRHYQDSPEYSLAMLADAAQRNDNGTIDAILDTDKITDDFVSQVRQRLSDSPLLTALWSPANPAASALTPKLKQTVHDEFVKELRRLTAPAAGKPFVLVALAIRYFANIKQEDKVAHAAVNIKDEHLELTMQWDGGRWRIVAVKDEKLAKQVAEGVKRSMPSSGTKLEDEIRKQLEKLKLP